VAVVPSGQAGAVKAAEAGGSAIGFACAGDSVDLNLSGVDTQVLTVSSQYTCIAPFALQGS
jgi:hypothetical protein